MIIPKPNATTNDILLRAVQCLSAFPAAFLLSLSSLVLYARARLGFWPTPNINDPKDIGVSYVIFHFLTLVLFAGLLTAVLKPPRGPRTGSARSVISWMALGIVLWALFVLVSKWDPGRYIEWIFD